MGPITSSKIMLMFVLTACCVVQVVCNSPTECLNEFISGIENGSWGFEGAVNDRGQPVTDFNLSSVQHIIQGYSYRNCTRFCGNVPDSFDWSLFSRQVTAWLLPWLALVSQLPFGAKSRFDNLVSVLLAVGSPTLAAYSLALTVLNRRWLAKRFTGISYPNAQYAFRILNSLQQAPLAISNEGALLSALVVLPQNDDWWADLCDWLNYVHTWSISAATSIAWVIIAYMFTVIDSFTDLNTVVESNGSDGEAIGSMWLWLLAVVVGWLQVSPKCDDLRLHAALARANNNAYIAVDEGPPLLAKDVSNARAFTLFSVSDVEDSAQDDELCSAPICNYARLFTWTRRVEEVSAVFRAASDQAAAHIRADGASPWRAAHRGVDIDPSNRVASRGGIESYCTSLQSGCCTLSGPKVISRVLLATCLALALQWGTTGAALVIMIYTPTTGLGCRSASYLLYALGSTTVWAMLVLSSILVQYSTCLSPAKDPLLRQYIRTVAVVLRRVAKLLATSNALWVVTSSLLLFGNFYDRCYCNAQILDIVRGAFGGAYDVIWVTSVQESLKTPWAGGLVLGCSCAVLFVGFIDIFLNTSP